MSFNIRYDNPADGPDRWECRRDCVAAVLRERRPDIAGLQEALRGQLADLEQRLPEYDWFGAGREDGGEQGEFVPIFYRRDRFERLGGGTFWLSETPEAAGSRGWDATVPRIATWARLKERTTGRRLLAVNTHLDHRGSRARENGARLLLERIARLAEDDPVVLTGDFNSVPASTAHRILTGAEHVDGADPGLALHDARVVSETGHRGPDSTWTGFQQIVPNFQIDFVFVAGPVQVRTHAILDLRCDGGRFASDHLPVLAEVELTAGASQGDTADYADDRG